MYNDNAEKYEYENGTSENINFFDAQVVYNKLNGPSWISVQSLWIFWLLLHFLW